MVKDDKYYRDKMVEDVDFIIEHMENQTLESLQNDAVLLDSMMFRLIQISESAHNLSEKFKNAHENIPWTAIYGLRNRIVHDYGNVDLSIIYNTLKQDVPNVRDMLEIMMDEKSIVNRIGVAKGKFIVPDDFDSYNKEITEEFESEEL